MKNSGLTPRLAWIRGGTKRCAGVHLIARRSDGAWLPRRTLSYPQRYPDLDGNR